MNSGILQAMQLTLVEASANGYINERFVVKLVAGTLVRLRRAGGGMGGRSGIHAGKCGEMAALRKSESQGITKDVMDEAVRVGAEERLHLAMPLLQVFVWKDEEVQVDRGFSDDAGRGGVCEPHADEIDRGETLAAYKRTGYTWWVRACGKKC